MTLKDFVGVINGMDSLHIYCENGDSWECLYDGYAINLSGDVLGVGVGYIEPTPTGFNVDVDGSDWVGKN